jgi:tetratricopeptide (TPR) repeat protein
MADTNSAFRYRAFISYSHADKRWSEWLHRSLETYRSPRKLVGRTTSAGPVPRRLTPVFRDRDDLPAAGDLSQEVDQALRTSQFLVVICSPAAAQSKWVNEEIRHFKSYHGEDRILAAIVGGEPFASNDDNQAHLECFPQALRWHVNKQGELTEHPAEPIAADFREGGDGKKFGRSKIAAGLLGVRLDDLIRREAQRRNTRMTLVACGSMAIAASMGFLAYNTLLARDEARLQRAEAELARNDAEGLIEFMLTDLREKLDAVGRLDALDVVGKRALDYYRKQGVDQPDADALGRMSRTQMLIGEVDNLRGDLPAALAAYEQAAATTGEQLRRDPDNPQRIFDHSQSVFWIGYVAWQRGNLAKATAYMQQYREFAERLVELQPGKVEWQVELGYAFSNLGTLLFDQRQWAAALDNFEASKQINERNVAMNPGASQARLDLGQDYSYIGETLAVLGRFHEATAIFEQEARLYDELIANAGQHQLAASRRIWSNIFIARIEMDLGEVAAAHGRLLALYAALQPMIADEAGDTRLQEAWVTVQTLLAKAQYFVGDTAAANTARQAVSAARHLAGTDPDNVLWHSYLADAFVAQARIEPHIASPESMAELEQLRVAVLALQQASPDNPFIAVAAADMERLAGELLVQQVNDKRQARRHWLNGLAVLPIEDALRTPREQLAALAMHAHLLQQDDAARITEQLDAVGFRNPEFLRVRGSAAMPAQSL